MLKFSCRWESPNDTRKGKNMADKPGNDDFEIIDSGNIEFVKRGRKSNVDSALVERLKTLPVGKTLSVKRMALNPTDADYRKDKARISSQIRNACRAAGLATFDIRWSVDGVPQVMR